MLSYNYNIPDIGIGSWESEKILYHLKCIHKPMYPSVKYKNLTDTIFDKLPQDLHRRIYQHQYNDVIIELNTLFFDVQDHF